ncbi:hypothetical protein SLOPH_1881 [Spraguea lophii 42_110]|uniref:C2H2-type domain-containing protein n=1 Tax=Spraguea lophii (strain 42_110) TaxID=1358809 RepID=S7W875_SPRLO|nr:hypothetical protein SLOPH_1881 [Spraguea lophii 42_110]
MPMYRGTNRRNQQPRKRYYQDIIDHDKILNMNKLLTEKEYKNVIKDDHYESYYIEYHNKRMYNLFNTYRDTEWFKDRYLRHMDNTPIYNNFDRFKNTIMEKFVPLDCESNITEPFYEYEKNVLLIDNISDRYRRNEIEEILDMDVESVIGLSKEGLKIIFSIPLNKKYEDGELEKIVEDKLPDVQYHVVNFEKLYLRRNGAQKHENDINNLKSLYNLLCSLYKINLDITFLEEHFKENIVDFYIYLLRYVFYFCYYCGKKHDTYLDLIGRCGDYHLRGGFSGRPVLDRKYELLLQKDCISCLKDYSEDDELSTYVEENGEEAGCGCCVKVFRSKEFVIKHLKQKHQDVVENVQNKIKQYETFKKNVDIFLLLYVKGINDNRIPHFVELDDKTSVKYNLPIIFSGEIIFE